MIDTDRACGLPELLASMASAVRVRGTSVRVTSFVPRRARSEVGARGLVKVREKLSDDNGMEEPRARAAADAIGGGGTVDISK